MKVRELVTRLGEFKKVEITITYNMVERFYLRYSERMRHYADFSKRECRELLEFAVNGKVTL